MMSEDIKQAVLLLNEVIDSLEEELVWRRRVGELCANKSYQEVLESKLNKLQAARTLLLNQIEPITPDAVVTNYSKVGGFTILDEVKQ